MCSQAISTKIQKHLSNLHKLLPKMLEISSVVTKAAGFWTPLKLYVLDYYMNIYTPIIKRHFSKMFYIDLLAGSGVSRHSESQSIVGSPIIAATFPKRPFNRLILTESDEASRNALIKRLDSLPDKPQFEVQSDCNQEINQIVDFIQEPKSHYLAFVDCARVEVDWNTIKTLLEYPGDLILNFQTSIIGRMAGSARKNMNQVEIQRLNQFFGSGTWMRYEKREEYLQDYKDKISNLRNLIESIRIKSKRGAIPYFYDLIIATRLTSGGSKWFEPIYSLKHEVEGCTGNDVRRIRDVLLGKSYDLPFFFKKQQPTLGNWQSDALE